ncbi:MAG TPA: hypothetical protein VHM30_11290 [Gemmatimonadaceae bacterium]|nr:hypothetical protein [Gemmatimonadaceae bacterium]
MTHSEMTSRRTDGGADAPLTANGTSPLRELIQHALSAALRGTVPSDGTDGPFDDQTRELLRSASVHARADGLRAEQLLLVVKAAWVELPEARRAPRDTADATLARVITRCIDEYYTEQPPPRRGS